MSAVKKKQNEGVWTFLNGSEENSRGVQKMQNFKFALKKHS